MSSVGKDRSAREARERSRVYQARQEFHESQERRRSRDNLIAGIGGGLLIVVIIAVQTLFFTVGPGAPAPEPTTSETPAPETSTDPAPVDSESPEPTPDTTPSETPSS